MQNGGSAPEWYWASAFHGPDLGGGIGVYPDSDGHGAPSGHRRTEGNERLTLTPRAQAVEALAVIAGLFLAASPWIVGFTAFNTLTVTCLIVGLAYCLLMAGYGSAYERTHARAWAATLLGAWTIISPGWSRERSTAARTSSPA
ncbi:SPW repeat protein [Kitasatospora aburaviensis]